MTYATAQDLIDRFGERELVQLTDIDEPRTDAVVTVRVQRALDDAVAEIDGYLAGLYTLPLTAVPATLRRVAVDLARYHLGGVATDGVEAKRYDDAIKFLRLVAAGSVRLGVDATGSEPPAAGNTVEIVTGSKVFARETYDHGCY
jgi:phage gp36-like protein